MDEGGVGALVAEGTFVATVVHISAWVTVNLVVQDVSLQRISDDSDCEDCNSECIAAVVRVTSKQY